MPVYVYSHGLGSLSKACRPSEEIMKTYKEEKNGRQEAVAAVE